ncbi:Ig-like domain repeat protein [Nocardioides terrigena]|uniref:Ig-like domain repeat protein n=1 Tax=Nocardioides terrigena TaxID=424797 RepID=UPI000D3242E0|nr:Ig-like domain repeat protein [Nocardioides terrigena]
MSTSASSRHARRLTHVTLSAAVAAIALQAGPASAAPDTPTVTGPTGPTGPLVELTWEPVAGATGYEVRVDNDPAFGSPEWTASTVNTVSVPTKMLAVGEQNVQVRAKDSGNAWSGWSSPFGFTVDTVAGPTLTGPDDGALLAQPADPPLLRWSPVPGATSYTVEVDTEEQFVGATSYTTDATALVVPDNQDPDVEYWWHVSATLGDGVSTEFSDTRSYTLAPIDTPTITGPADDEDITDVVLDWDPVAGAQYYELEVDDDFDFSSPETSQVPDRVLGTRFSPPVTFGNDQYFWRVRARDLDDNPTDWVRLAPEQHYAFDRVWRDVPQPVYPYDAFGAVTPVEDDLYFEWTPVPHASHYELWVSSDENFTDPSLKTAKCKVAGTTYTPGELEPNDPCMPALEGVVYYWKVRPMDLPYPSAGVEGIFSPAQKFDYRNSDALEILSPAEGASVQVPVLDWEPVPGTETYEVEILKANSTILTKRQTHSTSFTPMNVTIDGSPYRYSVRALDARGRSGEIVRGTFALSADPVDTSSPLQPVPSPGPTYDAPSLQWGAYPGADHYRMEIGNAVTENWFAPSTAPILNEKLPFPAATDVSTAFLAPGTYNWRVRPFDKWGFPLDVAGPIGQFEVLPLTVVKGQRLALTGSGLDAGTVCAKTLADGADQICDEVPATPVLDWDKVPYASEYRVHVSKDGDFTSGVLDPSPPRTVNTRWAPTFTYPAKALADSLAQTPYYWYIQPCKSATQCGPAPSSTVNPARHAFKKTSPRLELLTPAQGSSTADTEITFTWRDFFDTNQASTYVTGEKSYQSAMQYEFQIDDQPTFSSPLETKRVDQPTYTAAERLYPEGALYWRVQAIDVQGHALGWSETRTVTKATPAVSLVSPAASGGTIPVVSGAVPFRWEARPFARGYDIQVAANGDRNFSSANLKVNKTSKRSAYTTGGLGVPTLQASDTPYVWRVRRVDSFGNPGRWSAVGELKVVLARPTLSTPAAAAIVGPRGLVLRWGRVAEAAKYKVEMRTAGAGFATPVTTPATAWAPTTALTVGTTYEWRVASVDVDGRVSEPTDWRSLTIGGAPSASTPARINGTAAFGTALTAVNPVWNVPGVTNSYQWRRNGQAIPGATASSYTVQAVDVDSSLTVVVTGSSPEFGTGTSASAAVTGKAGAGPVVLSATKIAGTGKVGSVLRSTDPTWNPSGTTITRQWLRDGADISGATGTTYTVVAGDLNASITLEVTGTLPGRTPTASRSNAITAVQGPAVIATTAPGISGTPKVGLTLTGRPPTWTIAGVAQSIQWLRNGQPVSGATASTYVVRPEDVGASLAVRYTGRVPGRADGIVTSAPVTGLLGNAPVATATPAPEGSGKVGTVLVSTSPTWELSGVQVSVQWLRNGAPIVGETATTYAVRPMDVGASLSVRSSGVLPGRAVGTATSTSVTGKVGDSLTTPYVGAPTGQAVVGATLTTPTSSWTPTAATLTYQWLLSGTTVAGETGRTYVVRASDAGQRLAVRISAALPGYATGTATSVAVLVATPATPPPAPAPAPTPTPTPTPAPSPTPTPTPAPVPASSKTVLKVPKKVAAGSRAKVKIVVSAAGVGSPTGLVKIYAGRKVVAKVRLKAGANGLGKIRLPKLPKGKHKIRAIYAGGTGVTGSTARTVTLRVV